MNFSTYLSLGIEHITDPNGYDHILFIIAMCALYPIRRWRNVALLVTAFTLGHSIALALATFEVVPVWSELIEFLIQVTILVACFLNIWYARSERHVTSTPVRGTYYYQQYIWILFFGLIHGLGFSSFIRDTLVEGESILVPLLAFNIGLEIGQLGIVAVVFLINFVFLGVFSRQLRDWTLVVSAAVAGIAFLQVLEKGAILFSP